MLSYCSATYLDASPAAQPIIASLSRRRAMRRVASASFRLTMRLCYSACWRVLARVASAKPFSAFPSPCNPNHYLACAFPLFSFGALRYALLLRCLCSLCVAIAVHGSASLYSSSAMPGFTVRRRCRSYHRWAFPFHSFTMPRHSWPCVAITLIYASHFCCSSHPCNTFLVLRRSIQRSSAAIPRCAFLMLRLTPQRSCGATRLNTIRCHSLAIPMHTPSTLLPLNSIPILLHPCLCYA